MAISLLAYWATFSGQLYFRGSYFLTLPQHLTLTLWEHLFLRSSCFFKEARLWKSHFLAAVIFPECLIFRNETSTEQPFCKNSKFFRVATFRNSYFFGGVIAWNKDIYRRAPLIKAGTSAQHQLFQKSYIFEKLTFPGELQF